MRQESGEEGNKPTLMEWGSSLAHHELHQRILSNQRSPSVLKITFPVICLLGSKWPMKEASDEVLLLLCYNLGGTGAPEDEITEWSWKGELADCKHPVQEAPQHQVQFVAVLATINPGSTLTFYANRSKPFNLRFWETSCRYMKHQYKKIT